ncbi:MAG TPA: hypothetical protein VFI73_02695 [Candidatus Nitrosopolaris sp.]|nr:hypothetical protein [Candidatus Nitrosopolaris sp.]
MVIQDEYLPALNKSRYIDEISSQKSLTCIIAANGIDGCVIISDTRVMRDFEASKESKIYNMWENLSLVIPDSGTAALLDKFKMRIFNLKFSIILTRCK